MLKKRIMIVWVRGRVLYRQSVHGVKWEEDEGSWREQESGSYL